MAMIAPAESGFAELLRKHRRAAGYSQEALAERSRVSARAIAALEQGTRRAPYRDTVAALGEALGLSHVERAQLEQAAARARGRPRQAQSGLPPPLTSFIERSEVEDISALLLQYRLLTITGCGGVGKTRIALEVARHTDQPHPNVWFVDLLPVRDGKQLLAHVAARLHVAMDTGKLDAVSIARQLRSHRALLVLDNCEHLVVDAAALVGTLLHECPFLHVLATSREPLGHSAEFTFRLPPMNEATAQELFLARAQSADRSLYFDPERLAIVADICRDLDRIPLAIELAASRLSALGFDELRKRLRGGAILTGGRDLPTRHQTMDATISWSRDLLTDADRLLFERLSIFIGGFTLAAAEAVCADAALPPESIADGVLRLLQKSLIERDLIETSTRYRFLESIRSFAWQRLATSREVNSTMLRLLGWLVEETRLLSLHMPAPRPIKLRAELDNLAAGVTWAISTGHPATIVAAAWVLIGFRQVYNGTDRHREMRLLGSALLEKLQCGSYVERNGARSGSASAITQRTYVRSLLNEFVRSPLADSAVTPLRDLHEIEVQGAFEELTQIETQSAPCVARERAGA
jgi:predicted ATPase/DNA-binding XRE family transcriptional regulator